MTATAAPVAHSRPTPANTGHPPADPPDAAALQAALDALTAGDGVGAVAQVVGPNGRWSGASGVRRLERGMPAARWFDRARIASVTKPMVATLALQEVARGRWTLDTTVDDVLPGLLPGRGDVTLAQLLSHTSGVPDYLDTLLATVATPQELIAAISRRYTDEELVAAALSVPWEFEPGTGFGYSNTGYVVVGMMLSEVNHASVARLLEKRVFRPAGMRHSRLLTRRGIPGPHLTEYAIFGAPYSLATAHPSLMSSAGAVAAPAGDVNRFFAALSAGRLLPKPLLETMRSPLSVPPASPLPYGLGTFVLEDVCPGPGGPPRYLYGHDGGSFGTLTLSLSSLDGRRRFSVSVTGRNFDPAAPAPPIEEFAVAALVETCPTPVPLAAARRATLELPWLDGLPKLP
jgi:D-alanyl-D-alanine carboxypeptidase